MRFIKIFFQVCILFIIVVSCENATDKAKKKNLIINQDTLSEKLITVNKDAVLIEDNIIDQYLKRSNLGMKKSETGLRYNIKGEGGKQVEIGDKINLEYKVYLLNGELVYDSNKHGNMQFELGKSDIEPGLHEALLMMKFGQEATLILPYYLAQGLTGDNEKIPPKSSIIYKIKILN